MTLSKGKVRRYVKGGGVCCPYCGSPSLEGNSMDIDGPIVTVEVTCTKCKKKWQDLYKLYDVYEYDEDKEEGNG
jgi:hypothetical protein